MSTASRIPRSRAEQAEELIMFLNTFDNTGGEHHVGGKTFVSQSVHRLSQRHMWLLQAIAEANRTKAVVECKHQRWVLVTSARDRTASLTMEYKSKDVFEQKVKNCDLPIDELVLVVDLGVYKHRIWFENED